MQNCRYVIVEDKELRAQIQEALGQAQVTEASFACAFMRRFECLGKRAGALLEECTTRGSGYAGADDGKIL